MSEKQCEAVMSGDTLATIFLAMMAIGLMGLDIFSFAFLCVITYFGYHIYHFFF